MSSGRLHGRRTTLSRRYGSEETGTTTRWVPFTSGRGVFGCQNGQPGRRRGQLRLGIRCSQGGLSASARSRAMERLTLMLREVVPTQEAEEPLMDWLANAIHDMGLGDL